MSFSSAAPGFMLAARERGTVTVSSQQVYPEADAWVAAVHATADDYEPLGSGIVLDERRVLTCTHPSLYYLR
jgi:hypothetical protein